MHFKDIYIGHTGPLVKIGRRLLDAGSEVTQFHWILHIVCRTTHEPIASALQ